MAELAITLGDYSLRFDERTGTLIGLARGGPDLLGGAVRPGMLGAALAYQRIPGEPALRDHQAGDGWLALHLELGPLRIEDRYTLVNGLLARTLTVENMSGAEVQLTGVRAGVGGVAPGDPAQCRFEAPANLVRPRLPLAQASARALPEGLLAFGAALPQDEAFAPGAPYLWGRSIADAPDMGPGLLVVHNPALAWSFATWYWGESEAAAPWVCGDGVRGDLGFDRGLAGWLAPGTRLQSGTIYLMAVPGPYSAALAAYRDALTLAGAQPPIYPEPNRAAECVAIYEVHPGIYGGFDKLSDELRRIQQMGIDALYLLPVHPHRNKKEVPWDGNWESVGSPYAICDFEALDPLLGDEQSFHDLIGTAHDLGMRVLMDLVTQGCALEAPYPREHPEWFARDESGQMMHSHGWDDTWSFDWANPAYQEFVRGYARRWVEEFGIDGFRVDAPHGKEPNWARDLPYHASRTNLGTAPLLDALRRDLLAVRPDAALLCELNGPLWLRAHEMACDYHPYAMLYAMLGGQISPAELGDYLNDYWAILPQDAPRVAFTETHDTRQGFAYPLRGSQAARALMGLLVMAGFVPMIHARQERDQTEFLSGLLLARRRNAVLRHGQALFNAVSVDDLNHYRGKQGQRPAERVFTVIRHDAERVVFGLASFTPERVTYRFGLPVDRLPIRADRRYQLRDLISFNLWAEYGKTIWTGEELASFTLTPEMITPYIFRLEEVVEEGQRISDRR